MALRLMFATAALLLSHTLVCGQTARALLVTIDNYPSGGGWEEIHATNDIALMQPLLSARGFAKKNTTTLLDRQATCIAITEALEHLATDSQPGDRVYIHFSCHGQQMVDDNGDEDDGLDEALVPYDARRVFAPGIYEGANHLRDDRIGELTDRIRKQVGPTGYVVLMLDACHSGTANREEGDHYKRGTTYVFSREPYLRQRTPESNPMLRLAVDPELAPTTVLAACQPNQINYEYFDPVENTHYGALTYALHRVLQKGGSHTAQQLYDAVGAEIATMFAAQKKRQIPYIETTDETETCPIGFGSR